jgi:hypothetical protein
MTYRLHPIVGLAAALIAMVPAAGCAAESWGKVGAVNQDATGTPPGEGMHTLVVGAGVVHKESIKTSAQGSTQIVFPDTSTLNIGRNTTMVIDEFVYDPNAKSGTMVATLGHGAVRFVGGQISHSSGVTFQTQVATLGIRGGVASIVYPIPSKLAAADPGLAGCQGELVVADVGSVTLRNSASQVTIRPGFAACANGPNSPIGAPFRISDAALALIVAAMTSGPGQNGGGTTQPAGPYITLNGVGTVILDDPSHLPGNDSLGTTAGDTFGNTLAGSVSQSNQATFGTAPQPGTGGGGDGPITNLPPGNTLSFGPSGGQ